MYFLKNRGLIIRSVDLGINLIRGYKQGFFWRLFPQLDWSRLGVKLLIADSLEKGKFLGDL